MTARPHLRQTYRMWIVLVDLPGAETSRAVIIPNRIWGKRQQAQDAERDGCD